MYTPQEVQDKKFPKAVFGGYDMGEVDEFLDAVSGDYASLYKENTLLKNKLKVLADKVEEYRGVDAAMRKALIMAQQMANEITEEAKTKSDEIRNTALKEYEDQFEDLKRKINEEKMKLATAKEKTGNFLESAVQMCRIQMDILSKISEEPLTPAPAPVKENTTSVIDQKVQEIEQSLEFESDDIQDQDMDIQSEDGKDEIMEEVIQPAVDSREINVGGTNVKVFDKEFF